MLNTTWETLAREDMKGRWHKEPSEQEVAEWVVAMKEILADVKVGEQYVILDGTVFRTDSRDVEFGGWHSHHRLTRLPQVDALEDETVLKNVLSNKQYWIDNELPDRE
jgi:hypothetical protein